MTRIDPAALREALEYYDPVRPGAKIALIFAAARAYLDGEAWQPIETAPKDGTRVLLHHWGSQSVARWVEDFTDPHDQKHYDGVWMIFPCDDDPYYAHWTVAATHWRRLPAPPKSEA